MATPRTLMARDDLYYDFDLDAWVETPGIHARWGDRDLPLPKVAPIAGAWSRAPKRVARRIIRTTSIIVGLLGLLVAMGLHLFPLLPVSMALFGVAQLFGAYRPPLSPDDLRLLENPDDLDVCLVDVEVVRNGRYVGLDRGVAWFDGGRLLFNGHRTSFAIGGDDLLPRSLWQKRERNRGNFVPLRVPNGSAAVIFELASLSKIGPREIRFAERLHAFRQRPPRSRGPRQWPPFDL